jgi:3-hydroxyacyl-CoA dehydrogenase
MVLISRIIGSRRTDAMDNTPRNAFDAPTAELEARARQHLSGAAAAAAQLGFSDPPPAERAVARVGVIGGGTMGTGIAMTFANAGLPVMLVEASAPALEKALATIGRQYAATAAKGKLTSGQVEQRLALIAGGTDLARWPTATCWWRPCSRTWPSSARC